MRKNPVTIYLSEEDYQKLANISREKERSISSIVREVIKEWLKSQSSLE
jgi:predicted DNA-binding protein